jgi:hypothetical protein
VPVAISYELEPCDLFKAREVYLSRNGKKYNKARGKMNTVLLPELCSLKDMFIYTSAKLFPRRPGSFCTYERN